MEIFLVPFDPGWLPDPELLERIDAEATLIQEEKRGVGWGGIDAKEIDARDYKEGKYRKEGAGKKKR